MTALWVIVLCGALSIVYAIWATSSVLKADAGTARMQEIAFVAANGRRAAGEQCGDGVDANARDVRLTVDVDGSRGALGGDSDHRCSRLSCDDQTLARARPGVMKRAAFTSYAGVGVSRAHAIEIDSVDGPVQFHFREDQSQFRAYSDCELSCCRPMLSAWVSGQAPTLCVSNTLWSEGGQN